MNGRRIAITAARRAREQAQLVRSLGGEPVLGATIGCDMPADDGVVATEIGDALASPLDVLVVMTGIGAAHLLAVASRTALEGRLRRAAASATVIARGAKARGVLRRLDVRVDLLADPPTTAGLVGLLPQLDIAGANVAVVCTGPGDDAIVGELRRSGAHVTAIHPYAIDPPPESDPAVRLVREVAAGTVAAVTFTSANAVEGFAAIAARLEPEGLDPHPAVLVTAVGPVTRAALHEHGWRVHVEPATPRMGAMYQALAARLQSADAGQSETPGSGSTD